MTEASSTDLPPSPAVTATPAPLAPPPHDASVTGVHRRPATGKALFGLALGALGVVYGDIGTSPLYALKECFDGPHAVVASQDNVLGVLSLVIWAITFVVTFKYLSFVMRADNRGEGGILALMALVGRKDSGRMARRVLLGLGLFGAALLYGDGVITPAISVLSAVEGVAVAAPSFTHLIVPATVVILLGLFFFQKHGTHAVGAVFGPIMVLWFACIALLGLHGITKDLSVLRAVLPSYGVSFFVRNGGHGFLVLGSVVLAITGGEALYADMGHFGRRPIRLAWLSVALPALMLNYLGQGALLLHDPLVARNPFYLLAPGWALYPLIAIATAATIVASQALISGAFSLTRQAVQLGYLPRVTVVHTSGKTEGQIYIPEVNRMLMVACLALVLGFEASNNLADAYGIAVTGTMGITSVLFYSVARERWGWSRWRAGSLLLLFLAIDLSFFLSCFAKIAHGGWFPLVLAGGVFSVMVTWNRGRTLLGEKIASDTLPLPVFLTDVEATHPHRVSGTAVFLASTRRGTPSVLLHHFKHNKVLHKQVVILSVTTDAVPEVPDLQKVRLKRFTEGFWAVTAHYGFMESPDVMDILRRCRARGLEADLADTSFYLGRETLILKRNGQGMADWRKFLFRFLSRNARSATDFFAIPPNRVVEIGAQIEF